MGRLQGNRAVCVAPPAACGAALPGHDFADCYEIAVAPDLDAPEAVRRIFANPPRWAAMLMDLRDALVGPFGLKPAPSTGFPVISERPDEVVLGFDDTHLDFRIVARVAGGRATLTTLVRRHNIWGRLYLAAVTPFHRRIARAFAERMA
ncbi:hypothetical protein CCR94_15395 [Rhodoblastus sphagnicola]|uniref:DUF2867 domain-containing protein n=1 Tax=Rhodoblastus sphagnicola TaxID=333368 RepID=A0A2S6N423_9HYPH|nr:DUF2867 domain-containing protein [Rhodoblastus sphagnicola]MBB4196548.1 hypothetical protein [Rhodoblastus sphagnicola]PPQ29381.1 hypothetical protein CCR94_15395 [Rhodoblastus sphagnicola]